MPHARPATLRSSLRRCSTDSSPPGGGTASDGEPSTVPSEPPEESESGVATDLCELLRPEDFATAGVDGAGEPEATTDGTGSSYCVYAGESGATGGIELDVFPSADEASAKETFATATARGSRGQAGEHRQLLGVVVRRSTARSPPSPSARASSSCRSPRPTT